jgi:hypothetical protein
VYDNDLARSKEILTKLFEWFLFDPCTKQDVVFSLIKRILEVSDASQYREIRYLLRFDKSETGKALIGHHGTNTFKRELKQIRTYIEPKYYQQLEEISRILDDNAVVVPPLETDIPLSYRTGQSEFDGGRPVGTTATTIEGFIQQDASAHQQNM